MSYSSTSYRPLRVLFVMPPCLPTPPQGYGGIEAVAAALLPELEAAGAEVILTTPNGSTIGVTERHELTEPLYPILTHPYNDVVPGVEAYIAKVMTLAHNRNIDVIHDFSGMVSILNTVAAAARDIVFPPVLHTIHGPIGPYLDIYRELIRQHAKPRLTYTAISQAQLSDAPLEMRRRSRVIHNGLNPADFPLGQGGDRLLVLGRLCNDKGQDRLIAACAAAGLDLDVAGTVAEMSTVEQIEGEVAKGAASIAATKADFKFYLGLRHLIDGQRIKFYGNVGGQLKQNLLGGARAMVMPNRWAEPFGMVAIEAMASGTPVIAMKSGALPELIEHGVTGYLAETWDELVEYLKPEYTDRLDRRACQEHVSRHFSMAQLAQQYLNLYREVASTRRSQTAAVKAGKLITNRGLPMPGSRLLRRQANKLPELDS